MDNFSLYLPNWPIDRLRRRGLPDGTTGRTPILLTTINRERTLIASCCPRAAACGVEHGMPLAEARALLRPTPPPHIQPLAPTEDLRDLHRLARWAYRLVPIVAVDGRGGLFLDARGCARLYGGIDRLIARLMNRLQRAEITARLAAAPTFGAAWALARFGGGPSATMIRPEQLDTALAPLPVEALRLSPGQVESLRTVGVQRIDQLRRLPRAAIAARYGAHTLLRLDQAFGQALEAITPIQPKSPLRVEHLFEGPTDRLDAIFIAVRGLLDGLVALLIARHRGSLSLRVELIRSDVEPLFLAVRTSDPCVDAAYLWKLLLPKLERAHLGYGVEGVRLDVPRSRRLQDRQGTCWSGERTAAPEIARLIDTLHARLAPEQVLCLLAAESHLPERAFAFTPILQRGKRSQPTPVGVPADRPTVIHEDPMPIEVSLLVPDGPLMTLAWRGGPAPGGTGGHGERTTLRTCIGPERIGPEWWRRNQFPSTGSRDYFKVQTDGGRWLWIYREESKPDAPNPPARWFIHGEWA